MKLETILKELSSRGLNAEAVVTERNSVKKTGIIIKGDTAVSPIMYVDELLTDSIQDADVVSEVDNLLEEYKSAVDNGGCVSSMNIQSLLSDKNFVLGNLFVEVQRKSDRADVLRVPCHLDGIEGYMVVRFNDTMKTRVTREILALAEISIHEATVAALRNTEANATVESIYDVISELSELSGISGQVVGDPVASPMVVVSNKSRRFGAASALLKPVIEKASNLLGTKEMILLPASVHECILVPSGDTAPNEDELVELIRFANDNIYSEDVLGTKPIYISL